METLTINKVRTKQIFETFLKDEGLYEEFLQEYAKDAEIHYKLTKEPKEGVNDYLLRGNSGNYIFHAFLWLKTEKGVSFWRSVHEKWLTTIAQYA